ncbi:MAG: dTMP kinase [Pseudonocardiaceae bacterium]
MEQPPGVFVSVDGPCGVGKSTTIRALGERLRAVGVPRHLTAEPTGSEIGALACARVHSDTCGHALACLFAADRYHHLETEIRPRLAAGSSRPRGHPHRRPGADRSTPTATPPA